MRLPDKRRVVRVLSLRAIAPLVHLGVRLRLLRGWVILETTGRKSGLPRQSPVGARVDGDTVWLVSAHGATAAYVKNIEANPRVRVLIRGRWREGVAEPLPDDDVDARLRMIGNRTNALVLRAIGTSLLTIRVELDHEAYA